MTRLEGFDAEIPKIHAAVAKVVDARGDLTDFRREINAPAFSPLAFAKLVNAYNEKRLTPNIVRDIVLN